MCTYLWFLHDLLCPFIRVKAWRCRPVKSPCGSCAQFMYLVIMKGNVMIWDNCLQTQALRVPESPVQSTVTGLIKCNHRNISGNTDHLQIWRPPYTTVIWYSAITSAFPLSYPDTPLLHDLWSRVDLTSETLTWDDDLWPPRIPFNGHAPFEDIFTLIENEGES